MTGTQVLEPPPLKPCPFCGGAGKLFEVDDGAWVIGYRGGCADCRARTESFVNGRAVYEYAPRSFGFTDKLLAARAWNSRPGDGTFACEVCGVAAPHTHGRRDDGKILVILAGDAPAQDAALVPTLPESRDTPPRQTFEAWWRDHYYAGTGEPLWVEGHCMHHCRAAWDAAVANAAGGVAGATTAAAQEKP